jgi:4-hydroxy-4-methyl-2-oxoglutarate aldolase
MSIVNRIIETIEKNRISSVEVSDALGKKGVLDGIRILNSGLFAAGRVKYIYGFNDSNWPIHEQIKDIEEDAIIFVDMIHCSGNMAAFGDIVTKYLVLYRRAKGIVVNGLLRDVHTLKKNNYPLWCTGVTPLGCDNKEVNPSKEIKEYAQRRRDEIEGGVMVCDDSGCTLINKSLLTEDTLKRLEFVELQEDIWNYCINTLKWSTYDTICLKKYLTNKEELPKILYEKLSAMNVNA